MAGKDGRDVFRARDGGRDRMIGGADYDRAYVDKGIERVAEVEV